MFVVMHSGISTIDAVSSRMYFNVDRAFTVKSINSSKQFS